MTVAKGVAKDFLYFNACWHDDPAVAVAIVAHSNMALHAAIVDYKYIV